MHYYVDGKPVPVSFARDNLGLDAYLVCPGPSFWAQPDDYYARLFARGGAYVMGINTTWPRLRRPDAWVGLDRPECYDQRLWFQSFPKFSEYKLATCTVGGVELRACPQTYWFEVGGANPSTILLARDHNTSFSHTRNTFFVALHILIWMGARRIHFVGCDMSVKRGAYGADARAIGPLATRHNESMMVDLAKHVRQLAMLASDHGIEFVSCTEGSPINSHLPWIPLEEAVELSARRIPIERLERCRRINARELDECRWRGRVMGDEGIAIAVDSHEQWLLPWWLDNYRRHNSRPICIMDLGMTEDARAYAEANAADVREVDTDPHQFDCDLAATYRPAKQMGRAWFYKPVAIMWTPWERTLWSDLDVEVRGSLDPAFAEIAEGRIVGQAESLLSRYPTGDPCGTMMNAGLLGVNRGDPLIEKWARYCFSRHQEFYGDQDVLNYVMREDGRAPTFLPYGVCRLRLEGDTDPDALAFHWTGGEGKQHVWLHLIREKFREKFNTMWPYGLAPYDLNGQPNDLSYTTLPLQNRVEFLEFLELVRRLFVWPRVVELGAWRNQQKRFWVDLVGAQCHLAVDDKRSSQADVIGDTAQGSTLLAVKDALPGGRCDVLIVDADHRRALADHRLWEPLVRPGGLIAWHDINLSYVIPQWQEARRAGWESWEINAQLRNCGIGVMRKPGTAIPSRE